jgi:hypothetical protein
MAQRQVMRILVVIMDMFSKGSTEQLKGILPTTKMVNQPLIQWVSPFCAEECFLYSNPMPESIDPSTVDPTSLS